MKLLGEKAMRPREKVKLACGVEVTAVAPALGVLDRAIQVVPPPEPAARVVKSKGAPPAYLVNTHSQKFKLEEARASYLQSVYFAWEALRESEEVQFETPLPEKGADRAFVEKIARELEEGGFTNADVVTIAKFVARTAGATEEEADAAADFSDEEEPE
ncbi:MAG: hypothetical protein ACYS9X_22375 [Planctomycetota bacterium]